MIILDEQLGAVGIDGSVSRWYRGEVSIVRQLRLHTLIKDEAVPLLLLQKQQPTFVTINERDFWRRVQPHARYCIMCFALADTQIDLLPDLLSKVLRLPNFRTKAQRMGHILRVTQSTVSYYSHSSSQIQTIVLPKT